MRAEVISIGDELTSGQRLDTNSQWLSQRLGELGVETVYHTTVADDLEANVRVFAAAIERTDVVVATGGLGPTADDLTREALAAAAGRELVSDARIIRHRRIKCFGVGESDLEQMLPDLIRRGRTPSVGITVHEATITLRITVEGADDAECRAAMEPTARTIYDCLGNLVFGEED